MAAFHSLNRRLQKPADYIKRAGKGAAANNGYGEPGDYVENEVGAGAAAV
jgi:hypothetical protein